MIEQGFHLFIHRLVKERSICDIQIRKIAKLITAKIVSSLLFGTIAFVLHILIACGLPLTAFGVDGWNLQTNPPNWYEIYLLNSGMVER